jgi:ABC-type multidrug transport system ATPase subunit
MTDISNRTTLVTLYQAGEGIYELMDKVLVIDAGRMVYQGPANAAKTYFQNLGYYCPDRQTTADFLTACTDPTERRFRDDFDAPIPKGPVELEKAFRESEAYKDVLRDVDDYEKMLHETDHADAREFKQTVRKGKSKTVSKRSSKDNLFPKLFWKQIPRWSCFVLCTPNASSRTSNVQLALRTFETGAPIVQYTPYTF